MQHASTVDIMKNIIILAILSLFLFSCGSAPPKYTRANLGAANTQTEQIALYNSLKAELAANPKSSNAASYQQLMGELGRKLGSEEAEKILQTVHAAQVSSGLAPLNVLNEAETNAEPIRIWSGSTYTALIGDLRQSRVATEGALSEEQVLLGSLSGDANMVRRVQTLGRISDLYGDNAQAEQVYNTTFNDARDSLSTSAELAMQSSDFEMALYSYQSLKNLDPAFPGIDQRIVSAQSGIESSDFRQLLLEGNIEGAYASFLQLSSRPMSPAEKAEFLGSASNLAEYFSSSAGSMVRTGRYPEAYVLINRERTIREWTHEPSNVVGPTITGFTNGMFDNALASNSQDLFGLEYGYLLLVEEFNPSFVTLEEAKREAAENVYEDAIRRVSFGSIKSSNPANQAIASQIGSGVRQNLMVNIPEDVKIVERDMLEDVRREREMSVGAAARRGKNIKLESADFLIAGDLLTADVTEEVTQVKSRMRVTTAQEAVPNPAFTAWVKEKGKRKADHPDAPPRTIMKDIQEDITLNNEEHRKFGEVGVTYRVIDTATAELKHSESISRNMKVSDQAIEGVKIGLFVQEAKLAELPSNVEISNELVAQVVEAMAGDLVAFLANPDGDYFDNCRQLAAEGEYVEAAEQCAKAAVLREFKSQNNDEVVEFLKQVTLNSGMRSD